MGSSTQKTEVPKNLTLHGNILDNSSRTVMVMCKLASVDYVDKSVDFKGNQ